MMEIKEKLGEQVVFSCARRRNPQEIYYFQCYKMKYLVDQTQENTHVTCEKNMFRVKKEFS